ncbi:MAG: MFS transporter [Chloroflexota bacterium]|nr:MFS transporter [Chloroflexota bacterium]
MRLPRLHTLDAWLGYRNYRLLWCGNFFANSAQWLQLLSVGWLVRELSEGSAVAGLLVVTVGGINTLPGLIVGPWGGVLSDRFDRRRLVITFQLIMCALAFSFALLVLSDRVTIWHAYLYVILAGVCHSIAQPMRQALVAATVPRDMLGNALAANVLTITGTRIFGPFIGGILIFTLGFFWNFTIEACLYLANVMMLWPMRTPYYRPGDARARGSAIANMVEGIRYVWSGERAIFQMILLSIIPNIILHPTWFLFPVFTTDVLMREADVGGYLLAVTGVGGFLAALFMASFGFVFDKGKVVLGAAVASSITCVLFAYSHWMAVAFIVIAAMAFSQAVFRTTRGTLIQTLAPDRLRGRLTSLQSFDRGFLVVASLGVGALSDATSPVTAIAIVGALGLVLSIICTATLGRVRRLP